MSKPKQQKTIARAPALKHLAAIDPVMARIIKAVGPCTLKANQDGTHFNHIVRAIIYQQLSGKAAATIHGRVKGLFEGADPTAHQLKDFDGEQLRSAGLSRQKLAYIKDLATRVASGEVCLDDATIDALEDEAIIEALTTVKGVGRWTAQMFLMFRLGRSNVLPTVDLGINKAIMTNYKLRKMPKPIDVIKVGAAWAPHSTIACWYLWRSLEIPALAPKRPAKKKKPAKTKTRS